MLHAPRHVPIDTLEVLTARRDGLERVEVPDQATVGALRQAVHEKLNIPLDDIVLSKDASLVGAGGRCRLGRWRVQTAGPAPAPGAAGR